MNSLLLAVTLTLGPLAGSWDWPLDTHQVERSFQPPIDRYGPGHRGIDLPGRPGEPVRTVAAGTVSFAGQVGGVATVTIDHGSERSTYQPVLAEVEVGEAITRGQRIGTLGASHPSCRTTCLNLGRLRGDDYLDPVEALGGEPVRLVSPDGPPPDPPSWEPGGLVNLLGGQITSPFGMRVHPVTGQRKLHDGVDLAAACGTPVPALKGGTVSYSGFRGAYGEQIEVQHPDGRATSYSHLSGRHVQIGDTVSDGDVVGSVGTTGMSTGCHLHFMLLVDGVPVDPMAHAQ